jgi:1,5-anhydro-D-fructose reductase (1,5-anhydro-D-mannitol-forming)
MSLRLCTVGAANGPTSSPSSSAWRDPSRTYRHSWTTPSSMPCISRRRTSGVLLDLTVHNMDLLRFYFDAEPISVCGMSPDDTVDNPNLPQENATTVWQFADGLLLTCQDCFRTPYAGTSVAIHGDRGSIFGDEVLGQRAQGRVYVKDASGTRDIPVEHRVPYDRTIVDFVNAIRGQGRPSVTGEDGIKSLALALAASKSDPYHGAAVSGP